MATVEQTHPTETHTEHGHHHEHLPQLQHHFDTPEQQFESGKMGMWLFLATEILLFGGLFCAYAVYRANHPEIFVFAHHYLDTTMGALNTAVLIFSSFTMAWAVRASQLNKIKLMNILLTITVLCGLTFMVVKYFEYSAKWQHGLKWGTEFDYHYLLHGETHEVAHGDEPVGIDDPTENIHEGGQETVVGGETLNPAADIEHLEADFDEPMAANVPPTSAEERASYPEAEVGPTGLVLNDYVHAQQEQHQTITLEEIPSKIHIFFGIYFVMTGLHGIHVLLGMGAISWIIFRGARGDFSSDYYTPVDLVGLYWHVVDLIWIYLFPLLYLIH